MQEVLSSPLTVVKGERVGPFVLGMPLFSVLRALDVGPSATNSAHNYITFNESHPLDGNIMIRNLVHSIVLWINPNTQQLFRVEVHNVRVELVQKKHDFRVFTSSTPVEDREGSNSLQRIAGCFPKLQRRDIDGATELYDDTVVFRFVERAGKEQEKRSLMLDALVVKTRELRIPEPQLFMFTRAEIDATGIMTVGKTLLMHREHVQCVTADLGFPEGTLETNNTTGDYFYNYFSRGFDVLFDGGTHTVKRFVVHTNSPVDSTFGIYSKCLFTLRLDAREITQDTPWSVFPADPDASVVEENVELHHCEQCAFEVHVPTQTVLTVYV